MLTVVLELGHPYTKSLPFIPALGTSLLRALLPTASSLTLLAGEILLLLCWYPSPDRWWPPLDPCLLPATHSTLLTLAKKERMILRKAQVPGCGSACKAGPVISASVHTHSQGVGPCVPSGTSCFRPLLPTSCIDALPARPWPCSGLPLRSPLPTFLHSPGSATVSFWFWFLRVYFLGPLTVPSPYSGPLPLPALPWAPCCPQPLPSSHLSRAVALRGRCGRARRSSRGPPRRTCQV